jgi:hypothetical protein
MMFLLLFLSLNLISQKSYLLNSEKEDISITTRNYDTILIKAIEISYLDAKIMMILDNHIKEMPKNHIYSKKKYYCIVNVFNVLVNYYTNIYEKYLPNIDNIIDSINGNYEYFKNYDFWSDYKISVLTTNRKSHSINKYKTYSNLYYYKYKGFDVLFASELNIEFPNNEKQKNLIFIQETNYSDKNISENDFFTFYELDNYFVIQNIKKPLFDNSNGIPMKKKYLEIQKKTK